MDFPKILIYSEGKCFDGSESKLDSNTKDKIFLCYHVEHFNEASSPHSGLAPYISIRPDSGPLRWFICQLEADKKTKTIKEFKHTQQELIDIIKQSPNSVMTIYHSDTLRDKYIWILGSLVCVVNSNDNRNYLRTNPNDKLDDNLGELDNAQRIF